MDRQAWGLPSVPPGCLLSLELRCIMTVMCCHVKAGCYRHLRSHRPPFSGLATLYPVLAFSKQHKFASFLPCRPHPSPRTHSASPSLIIRGIRKPGDSQDSAVMEESSGDRPPRSRGINPEKLKE